ncbi:MAG: PaaI family thioesterase, partial [Candidatus Rokuibacteriota bacterium]
VLQSWPGIVHGGGLVALLDAAAAARGPEDRPRRIEARLTSSVPLETVLDLEGHVEDGAAIVTILDRAQPLTSATITIGEIEEAAPDPGWRAGGREGWPMPLSDQCLACGAHNPLGLQLGLRFDADGVWARFEPREPWRRSGNRLDPALPAVALDEVAWWLGALATKEGGLTNRISLTLLRPDAAAAGPVTAVGRFTDVTPVDRRRAFWRTRSALLAADGAVLATATIVFRAGADFSSRQMAFFRSRTDPEIFERMFPNYQDEGSR